MVQKVESSRVCLLFEGEQVPNNEGADSGLLKSKGFRIISAIGWSFFRVQRMACTPLLGGNKKHGKLALTRFQFLSKFGPSESRSF
jgi:hypothetical protein